MVLPALTVCSKSGFKTNSSPYDLHTNLSGFLEDSYSREELILNVNEGFLVNLSLLENITTIYSKYRGRCYTVYSDLTVI